MRAGDYQSPCIITGDSRPRKQGIGWSVFAVCCRSNSIVYCTYHSITNQLVVLNGRLCGDGLLTRCSLAHSLAPSNDRFFLICCRIQVLLLPSTRMTPASPEKGKLHTFFSLLTFPVGFHAVFQLLLLFIVCMEVVHVSEFCNKFLMIMFEWVVLWVFASVSVWCCHSENCYVISSNNFTM